MNELHAWIAGLYEGEGYIGISVMKSRRAYRVLRIMITNTDMDLLLPIKDEFGGQISTQSTGRKPCYVLRISDVQADKFIDSIMPFIKSRRRRMSLKLAKKFRMLKHDPERIDSHGHVAEWMINEELAIRNKMIFLNSGRKAA